MRFFLKIKGKNNGFTHFSWECCATLTHFSGECCAFLTHFSGECCLFTDTIPAEWQQCRSAFFCLRTQLTLVRNVRNVRNGIFLNLFDCYISLIFIRVTRRVGTPVFFLSYLCRKKMKKSWNLFVKRNVAVVYLHPHFRKAARQTARITAASLLHHRCIAADTL